MQRRSQTKSRLHQLHNKRSQTALRKLRTILGEMEPVPLYHILSNVSVMDKEGFSKGLGELLDSLGSKIVDAYETSARVKGTVYALAQCIPDLSKSDCRICLSQIFAGVPTCCDGKSEEKQPLSPPKNDTKISMEKLVEGTAVDLIVHVLLKSYSKEQSMQCLEIAFSCVQENPTKRPTMDSVVSMLSSDSEPLRLPKPSQPGFFRRSMSFSVSVNDVSLTDLSGR
uniref:Gnk2-homologous domain-containing protein n=1 Tax=Brassica campestris TaxID=3711 RepID=A0A3P5Z4D1_BRACM|nr:unnamed protein product [Brassica rapa]